MNTPLWIAVFVLDHQRYALYLSAVERVVPAVEITSLPKAPDIVAGVINMQGRIIAVVDVRKRFGLSQRELMLSDQMLIARTRARSVAMVVDAVTDILEYTEDRLVPAAELPAGVEYIDGIIKLSDGLVLIHDIDKFLSLEEQHSLERALAHS